ncbi:MAG TPA: Hpt domain-containing protein [Ottowia sp.]|uniref:hybrid sensor histidine kinase/response regulator n=1 Tax=Ottowia sp. TaxID=1898956 RepID=UPI002B5BCBDA|nr:Hpt domain-containing protein [Ottowia sp.]HMN19801.1 Hpt domain-containing protein [Ottowia sp.]
MATLHPTLPASEALAQASDLGPLAWVLEETRKSVQAATKALKRFAHEAERARGVDLASVDASQLRVARQQLHQVAGALEMVEQDMAARMVRGMEAVAQQFVAHPDRCSEAAAATLERCGFALVEFVQDQLSTRPRPTLGLFPAYRQVQEMAGADRIHPADLWSVPWRWLDADTPAAAQPLACDPVVRQRFDHGVLKVMKRGDVHAAAELATVSRSLAAGVGAATRPAMFWKLVAGFFEALAQSLLPLDVYVKRAASRILLQYTTLARGDAEVSERLAHDLLFFCGQAQPVDAAAAPVLAAVRAAWGLDALAPVSYEVSTFGLYDPAVLAQARRRIESIKENWSALAGGDIGRLKASVDQFGLVVDSLERLHERSKPLAQALAAVAALVGRGGQVPAPELAIETATTLLFLEASFEDFRPDDVIFAQRMDQLAARLDAVREGGHAPGLEPWMEELYRSVSDKQTLGTVVGELRVTLGEVEQHLDRFFRQPADTAPLDAVPDLMQQMRGVLNVLGLDQAALAVGRMREQVEQLRGVGADLQEAATAAQFETLGNSLGALGFLIDTLGYQPTLARQLFFFDADSGEFHYVIERTRRGFAELAEAPATAPAPLEVPSRAAPLELPASDTGPVPIEQLEQIAARAALDERPALAQAASRAAEAARQDDGTVLDSALRELESAASDRPMPLPTPEAAPEEAPLDDDDDLLEIFLEEAREVLATGNAAIATLADAPADLESLTTLRRAFHTLKGSSRMVGLAEFGAAAWALEQLLNAWLAEQKTADAPLRTVAGDALAAFGQWVEAIAGQAAEAWRAEPFEQLADALRLQGEQRVLALAPQAGAVAEPLAVESDLSADAATAEAVAFEAAAPALLPELPDLELGQAGLPEPAPALAEDEAQQESATDAAPAQAEAVGFDDDQALLEAEPEGGEPLPAMGLDTALAAFDLPGLELSDPLVLDSSFQPASQLMPLADGVDDSAPAPLELDAGLARSIDVLADTPPEAEPVAFELDLAAFDQQPPGADAPQALAPEPVEDDPAARAPERLESASEPAALVPEAAAEEEPAALPPEPAESDPAARTPESVEDESAALAPEPAEEALAEPAPARDQAAIQEVGDLRISQPLYNVYLGEAETWSERLLSELSEWALHPEAPMPERAIACAHSLAGSSATVGFTALSELARALEHALDRLQGQAAGTAEQAAVLGRAADDIRRLLHQFAAGALKAPAAGLLAALHALEPAVPGVAAAPLEAGPQRPEAAAPLLVDAAASSLAPLEPLHSVAVPLEQPHELEEGIDVVDGIDPDLFPIFEEEADELLPRLSAALRQWVAHPGDLEARAQVLRVLHTLKGSARLAGALRLGEMAHRTESAVEALGTEDLAPGEIAPLQEYLDHLLGDFQQLRTAAHAAPAATPLAAPEAPARVDEAAEAAEAAVPQPQAEPELAGEPAGEVAGAVAGEVAAPTAFSFAAARVHARQTVRVRAQLLDRLMAQAGEVMTARARLEADMKQLRNLQTELASNVERLRRQVRDVELQAETQMQSRLAQSRDAQHSFDPLELDRFTRMQEVTRMMAESVNDVATVQRNLQRVIDSSEDDLAAQARQSRALQDDLLRTRMVEFDGISERLYRVVRQAAKVADKQVRLDILGGSIEIDRGILDRMTPAFEHLLRNCVVHGIEAPAERSARGKDATGVITITVQQSGNDVAIEFADDGAGLDLERIRARALERGLIQPGQALADGELAELIFAPGFSTAREVTEIAGRGVGTDVVRSEVLALGGRLETRSEASRGAAFRLVLPLTTAVTQVVMIRVGDLVVGVPASLVEILLRGAEQDLDAAYESGVFGYDGEAVPFFWAGTLLQHSARSSDAAARKAPVLILRSAAQRVALHVDEVLGNQEVVIKALGPQLSHLPGLVAITALASGAVRLIYNPVALASVYGERARAFGTQPAAVPATALPGVPTPAAASHIPLVLVVDDSITVRRVTQRLLQREGYRVALAADGLQGLERLQQERPAVVLSDIEMPRMDGFDFLRNIRADADLQDLPVVMITSRIAEKHREHARQLGADHYLGKPYSEQELLELIRAYAHAQAPSPVL